MPWPYGAESVRRPVRHSAGSGVGAYGIAPDRASSRTAYRPAARGPVREGEPCVAP
ncbi:hypothetical protein [Streptomyces sp. NPDC057554]|uniref:hypothetical protein n=1 Tax=Streptomyces sp. NPDC057554 TaxID=3350538 RepID=UPI0036D203A1